MSENCTAASEGFAVTAFGLEIALHPPSPLEKMMSVRPSSSMELSIVACSFPLFIVIWLPVLDD